MILLLFALLQAAVPPPMPQIAADCAAPVYASDRLVCSDPDLASLDADLVRLLANGPVPEGQWIEPQHDWFRRSRLCAFQPDHAGCLTAAYRERIGLLRANGLAAASSVDCKPGDYRVDAQPEGLAVRDRQGRLVGLATTAGAGWKAFLELRRNGGGYAIHDQNGHRVLRCPNLGPPHSGRANRDDGGSTWLKSALA